MRNKKENKIDIKSKNKGEDKDKLKEREKRAVIVVSGTPGTGKTRMAKKISQVLRGKYLDVNEVIKKEGLRESYDKKRKCSVVDIKKLNKILIKEIKKAKKERKDLVIDSHLAHELPENYADLCLITKCSLKKLKQRLEKRGYDKEKIKENLEAEIFDICQIEAKEKGHQVVAVRTDKPQRLKELKEKLEKWLNKKKSHH